MIIRKAIEQEIMVLNAKIKANKNILNYLDADAVIKSGNFNLVTRTITGVDMNNTRRYVQAEIQGTTMLRPRFKFYLGKSDEVEKLNPIQYRELVHKKVNVAWKNWVEKNIQ